MLKLLELKSQAESKKLKVMFVWFKKQENQISKMEHKQIKSRYKHQLNTQIITWSAIPKKLFLSIITKLTSDNENN